MGGQPEMSNIWLFYHYLQLQFSIFQDMNWKRLWFYGTFRLSQTSEKIKKKKKGKRGKKKAIFINKLSLSPQHDKWPQGWRCHNKLGCKRQPFSFSGTICLCESSSFGSELRRHHVILTALLSPQPAAEFHSFLCPPQILIAADERRNDQHRCAIRRTQVLQQLDGALMRTAVKAHTAPFIWEALRRASANSHPSPLTVL